MKKLILILIVSLMPVSLFGQFVLTPTGFVNKDNPEQDYYVLEFPGRSKKDLFNSTMVYLTSKFISPYDTFNVVEGEMITLNGVAYNGVATSRGVFGETLDVWFNIQIEFRDGRMRVMRPIIRNMIKTVATTREVTDKQEIKDKDGNVVQTKEIKRNVPSSSTSILYLSPYYLDGDERPVIGVSQIYNKKNKLKKPVAKETLEDYFNTLVYGLFRQVSAPGENW